jgi:hypothetical protein
MSRASGSAFRLVGLTNRATTAVGTLAGATSRSNSRRFTPISLESAVTPVILPPGRLRLATSPCWTGSEPMKKTIGIVAVAALAVSVAGGAIVTITSTWRRTRSAAIAGSRS